MIFTLGDPHSINIEAMLKIIVGYSEQFPVLVIGSKWHISQQAKLLGLSVPDFKSVTDNSLVPRPGLYLLDPLPDVGHGPAPELSVIERGQLAKSALEAVPVHVNGTLAVLTAPIDKKAIVTAGFSFPGQTEFFEHRWQGQAIMLLAGPKLRVGLVTNHLPLQNVTTNITEQLVVQKGKALAAGLQKLFGIERPRIGVCGINPHIGDGGLFGIEDDRVVRPAVEKLSRESNQAVFLGPLPADTVFYRAYHGAFDAVLAMYHDQGLGPLKTVHFDEAVNVSLGLRYLRVSPDHGPAADLFGKGMASMRSFESAAKMCVNWLRAEHDRKGFVK